MCRNRRLGGRRCPLHSSAGFVSTRLARSESGLDAAQVNAAFRVLRVEGENATGPTIEEWSQYLQEKATAIEEQSFHGRTMRTLRNHVIDAADNIPDGPTYYALKNLDQRTVQQREALDTMLNRLSLRTGISRTNVNTSFNAMRRAVDTTRTAPMPEHYSARAFRGARAAGLPLDTPTVAALGQLYEVTDNAAGSSISRVTNHVTVNSNELYSIGHDATDDGRLEVRMRNVDGSPANTVFAYRNVDRVVADRLMYSGNTNVDESLRQLVTSRAAEHAYNSIAEANGDSQVRRCAECGQFASLQHSCPEGGSVVVVPSARAISPTVEEIERVRDVAQNDTIQDEEETVDPVLQAMLDRREPLRAEVLEANAVHLAVFAERDAVEEADDIAMENGTYDRSGRAREEREQIRIAFRERINNAYHTLNAAEEKLEELELNIEAHNNQLTNAKFMKDSYSEQAVGAPYTGVDLERDSQNSALEFTTENVTNGLCNPDNGMGFGIELEFMIDDESDLDAVAQDLHAAGLSRRDYVGDYHSSQNNDWDSWSLERDMTVSAELVSPILHDTPEDWEQIRKVCQIIESHGGHVSEQTGGHIHMSSGRLGSSVAKHAELINMANEHEDVIYRLGTEPGKDHRTTYWCAPNKDANEVYKTSTYSRISGTRTRTEDTSVDIRKIRQQHSGHNVGMNIADSGNGPKSHVEFRQWDGSLNPAIIQSRILIGANMVNRAANFESAEPTNITGLASQRTRRAIGHHAALPEAEKNQGFLTFQTQVLSRPEDRAKVTALYSVTAWQHNLPKYDATIEDEYDEDDYDEDGEYYD